MENNLTDNLKSFLFTIIVGVCALLIIAIVAPYQKYTFKREQPYADVAFQDIAYFSSSGFVSQLVFMDEDGTNRNAADVFIPMGKVISIFGDKLYEADQNYHNEFVSANWSPDGKTLGVVLTKGAVYPYVPALINENSEMLTCLRDPYLDSAHSMIHMQAIDEERILINQRDHLSLYNMKICQEESIYYETEYIENFSVSSKGWLAISERIDGEDFLNVYDEHGKIVFSHNESNSYYFITWSKDGSKLFFTFYKNGKTPAFHDFKTGETIEFDTYLVHPSFSPDGERMISSTPSGKLIMIDLNTMEETIVGSGGDPDWRPDVVEK